MATIEQARIYNRARLNEDWEDVESDEQAAALLQDAEDYIRAHHDLRSNLEPSEQRLLDNMIYRLAATFLTNPPSTATQSAVKKESVEGDLGKVETEYFEGGDDPYAYVSVMLASLVRKPSGGGLVIGRLVR